MSSVGIITNWTQQPTNVNLHVNSQKKRDQPGIMATTALTRNSRRLFIRDRRTNVTFLIDTGSDVSRIPATKTQRQNNSQMTLSAADTSPIHVYKTQALSLDFGLRRIFKWTFLVVKASIPIIGADFLYNFCLIPDITSLCSMAIAVKPFSRSTVVVEHKIFLINFNLEKLLSPLATLIGRVAVIRHISHSCLDPNDFTVVNCIVKGHASLSPPSLRLRLYSRFTLLATYTYFDPKDFSPQPSTVSKVIRPFHPLLNKKQRKK
ncbi:transposon Ty3-G Gag-Pol polyprotein [Trichonephila clavipes]|nr:transposon Ty3-G Gag-Pol polyprotein [Trichonephila clavipes]